MNSSGVVVWGKLSGGHVRGFTYDDASEELPVPSNIPGFSSAPANAVGPSGINDSGTILCLASKGDTVSAFDTSTPAFYSNGTMVALHPSGIDASFIYTLNNNGDTGGMSAGHPALGTVGNDLTVFPLGDDSGRIYKLNDAKDMVGVRSSVTTNFQGVYPFASVGGVVADLVQLDEVGFTPTAGLLDINNSGQAVGWIQTTSSPRGLIFSNGVRTYLPSLKADGSGFCEAYGINDYGQVVGTAVTDLGFSFLHAFIYVPATGLSTDLNAMVDPALGWTLSQAWVINNAGQIAGFGTAPDNTTHIFRLDPTTPTSQPDLSLGTDPASAIGRNIFNATGAGQSVTEVLGKGKRTTVAITIKNAGNDADNFSLKGTAGTKAFSIRYLNGKKDVTKRIVKGKFKTGNLVASASLGLTLKIRGKTKAANQSGEIKLAATSSVDKTKVDAVRVVVQSAGAAK